MSMQPTAPPLCSNDTVDDDDHDADDTVKCKHEEEPCEEHYSESDYRDMADNYFSYLYDR